jgi:hypothetical protein
MRLTPRVAGFRSEYPAGFKLECMAGFVGTRNWSAVVGAADAAGAEQADEQSIIPKIKQYQFACPASQAIRDNAIALAPCLQPPLAPPAVAGP